ncbi:MAG TPA: ABC transporter permease [Candidatus Didemnitutus sp.]|nr:ABC transporter permease [Candidatus Didemnitutus sp.]
MNGRAFLSQIALTLRLNFRSPQALVYGFAVPVLFLIAFRAVFQSESPPLAAEMGQVLTITILGGACFGLPTALVAEREMGIWRRYRLLPVNPAQPVVAVLTVRLVLLAAAVGLQGILARLLFHAPPPSAPFALIGGALLVAMVFLGLGLLVASLARDVPAVQALGQCLFLPMILVGGVGVPLVALPSWAREVAAFMPGRYAVEVLDAGWIGSSPGWFSVLALAVMGVAAGAIGLARFRWDSGPAPRGSWRASSMALLAWLAVGLAALASHRVALVTAPAAWEAITRAQVMAITYDDLPGDAEFVTRLAPPFPATGERAERGARLAARLAAWPPGTDSDPARRVMALLSVASIADVSRDLEEGDIARAVFDRLRVVTPAGDLPNILAWVALEPAQMSVVTTAPELELPRSIPDWAVRQRNALFARKFLGRLLGRLKE